MTCSRPGHSGEHVLDWASCPVWVERPGYRVVDAVEVAVRHADPSELDAAGRQLATVDALVATFKATPIDQVKVTDAEFAAVVAVLDSACSYMSLNHYADDGEMMDDQSAAIALGEFGGVATICWTGTAAAR